MLAGADRRDLVDTLVGWFESVRDQRRPAVFSIEGDVGIGKTRVVQEVYARLAADHQPEGRYWPKSLIDDGIAPVTERKRVAVQSMTARGGVPLPWLWWGIDCNRDQAGSPLGALKLSGPQLHAHADLVVERLKAKAARGDDVMDVVRGAFDILGIIDPGSVFEGGSKLIGVVKRRKASSKAKKRLAADRMIHAGGDPLEQAEPVAELLAMIARAGIPVVLAIEDAHWADRALVSVLNQVLQVDAPILVLTSAWHSDLAHQCQQGRAETFGAWLDHARMQQADRVARFHLRPMTPEALTEMVCHRAPKTEPDAAARVAKVADGHPLRLELLLRLDVVARDIQADGRIDMPPERLRKLPTDLDAIYRELWTQLPQPIRSALVIASVQGRELLPAAAKAAITAIGRHGELDGALDDALSVHGWLRAAANDRWQFVDTTRFNVAEEALLGVLTPEEEEAVKRAVIDHVLHWRKTETWPGVDPQTRRLGLQLVLDLNDPIGQMHEAAGLLPSVELASVRKELARLLLDAGDDAAAERLADAAREGADAATAAAATDLLIASLLVQGKSTKARSVAELTATPDAELLEEAVMAADEDDEESDLEESATDDHQRDEWGRRTWVASMPRPIAGITDIPVGELAAAIVDIVRAEGPVTASRVTALIRNSAGASRMGRQMAVAFDRALRHASRRGDLRIERLPRFSDPGSRKLSTPEEPEVDLRTVGDGRQLADVPADELAALARRVYDRTPTLTREKLVRQIVSLCGWSRLSANARDLLERAIPPEVGAQPNAVGTDGDQIAVAAERHGVSDELEQVLEVGRRLGFGLRRWRNSFTLTPPSHGRHTLVYVAPRPDGLHLGYSPENFQLALALDATALDTALGPNWTSRRGQDVERWLTSLQAVVNDRSTT